MLRTEISLAGGAAYAVQITLNPSKIVYKNSLCISEGTESIFDINTDQVMPFGKTITISIYYFTNKCTYNKLYVVCFPGVTTHCGCIFHSPVAGFSLLVFEVS
jgi:hypothetical protein